MFRSLVSIIAIDGVIIDKALGSNTKDFEDSIQFFAAVEVGVDFFITRNGKDYPKKGLSMVSPQEFIGIVKER